MAERYLRRSLEREKAPCAALIKLAWIYERQRRPEKAAELVSRVLRSNASNVAALFVQARLERLAGHWENAEKGLRLFLSKSGMDAESRARGWYELGGILDVQKRYDEAMAAFLEAKKLLRPFAGNEIAQLQRIQAKMLETEKMISADVLHRWFDFGAQLQPPHRFALLCGHPRSGTTLLEQVLDSHGDLISMEESLVFTTKRAGRCIGIFRMKHRCCLCWNLRRRTACVNRARTIFISQKLYWVKPSAAGC